MSRTVRGKKRNGCPTRGEMLSEVGELTSK